MISNSTVERAHSLHATPCQFTVKQLSCQSEKFSESQQTAIKPCQTDWRALLRGIVMVSVGTVSQNRESSSALVPTSVLSRPVNTEPVQNQDKYRQYNVLELWCTEREGHVTELMKERMRKKRAKQRKGRELSQLIKKRWRGNRLMKDIYFPCMLLVSLCLVKVWCSPIVSLELARVHKKKML